jgi:EAL domain-containing protein (putative c-di-GMP-specific phosphodiesterase class I)
VRLSVDDFGTGYSSLANLKRLPIDELKIDRSFVSPMMEDESDLIIVRSTINLGHDLGLTVIAEGVEDELTLKRLGTLGCDLAQGYHLSRPLAPDAFAAWVAHNAPAVAA